MAWKYFTVPSDNRKKEQLACGFQVKNILKPNDILLSSKIGAK